jgi:hypothetical protein
MIATLATLNLTLGTLLGLPAPAVAGSCFEERAVRMVLIAPSGPQSITKLPSYPITKCDGAPRPRFRRTSVVDRALLRV